VSHDAISNSVKVSDLPPIPDKLYFTIGEVSELCAVKPHVLRYWEQEFKQLTPLTRRGKRRYYQQKDIKLIRKIRALLYEEGFTINGANEKMDNKEGRGNSKADMAEVRRELESILELLT
jgi:DNA-binding transcriptional MerR regulator